MRLTMTLAAVTLALSLACGGSSSSSTNDDFSASIDVPGQVSNGESFEMTVTVFNTASESQKLYSLDLADEYMSGVDVVSSDPPYSSSMHVPFDNTESYEYMQPIPPGGSTTVVLTMQATTPGSWSGDIDVCVDGMARFISYSVSTTVQ